jgi:NADPH-dependent 2,4-dienoyl-CoA reductase/sulfur reductase-like enzyme
MSPLHEAARERGIVVVGAGQAGGRAVEALRGNGFGGAITLIGDEEHSPYERPSLSKEMLLDVSKDTVAWVHADDFFEKANVTFRKGVAATRIDRLEKRVHLSDGGDIGYGALILATGARVRRLDVPGAAQSCTYLRSLQDSRALTRALLPNRHVLVIGAGFIGLEVAAAAIQRGCTVTVLEAGAKPLQRVAPPELGRFYESLHSERGVVFHFNTEVASLERLGDKIASRSRKGDQIVSDLVVAGIGVIPNTEVAAQSGLVVDRGILVDAFGATNDPAIFAVGDVAQQFDPRLDRHQLLESWQSAQNQAINVARNLAQNAPPAASPQVPWFWSDQYGHNLQMYGLAEEGGETVMRFRDNGSWLLFQLKRGSLIYAAAVDAARDLRPAREFIATGAPLSAAILADPAVNLAELARQMKRASSCA